MNSNTVCPKKCIQNFLNCVAIFFNKLRYPSFKHTLPWEIKIRQTDWLDDWNSFASPPMHNFYREL